MIRRRNSGHYSAVALGHISSALTTCTINISISGQDTTVVLDTGSSELWVDPTCSMAAGDNVKDSAGVSANDQRHSPDYCESIGRYDPALSPKAKDLKNGDTIVYVDTTAEVNYYTDNIFIGGAANLRAAIRRCERHQWNCLGGHGYGAQRGVRLQLFFTATQPCLGLNGFAGPNCKPLWGVDQKKFLGSLQTLPLESLQMAAGASGYGSSHETITVHGYFVTVQSLSMTKPNDAASSDCHQDSFLAVLDSGTNVIMTPEAICSVPCDLKSQSGGLDVNFDGKTIRVDFENLVAELEQQGQTFCVLAVTDTMVASDPPTYILGSPFLKAAYAVFDWDNQQLNLAQAADCGSQVVAIGTGPGAVPTGVGCEESAALPPVLTSVGPVMAVAAMTSILALI
ncbi:acid protease [Diaporthe eres]|nr:acid protease [Diaporthe eres]